jgi:hypothetical protein
MSIRHFDVPVTVAAVRGRRVRLVSNANEAAELLAGAWAVQGPKHRLALLACRDAVAGRKSVDEARKAFADAAREAGILVNRPAPFGKRI